MKDYLKHKLNEALIKIGAGKIESVFERPKEEKFGDLSTNAAMLLAKELKKNPREIADEIISNMELPDPFIKEVNIAGAGFINFFISNNYYTEQLKKILSSGDSYGKSSVHQGETANIEWVSANPTGPLHAGHGRHIALGKAVANLLEWTGYKLTREYYYNDAGNQMDNLAISVYARIRQIYDHNFPFPENGYVGEYINEIAIQIKQEYDHYKEGLQSSIKPGFEKKESDFVFINNIKIRDFFAGMEEGNKDIVSNMTFNILNIDNDILQYLKLRAEEYNFLSIIGTLKRLNVKHDIYFNESNLYRDGKINEILTKFYNLELSYEKDGAWWLGLSEFRDEKGKKLFNNDKVIVKSTGEPTYRLPDMAYHIDKLNRGYNTIVDIFGSDHSDTYKEVLAGVSALGYDTSKIKVIIHQMVTFVHDGKPVKMSKRSDNVYYLDDLLDDVGEDVAQFFFVMRSANTHLDFDIKLAKEQSEKNPVFYLQYAHARICGILRNAESELPDYNKIKTNELDFSLLKEQEEIDLIKSLTYFPEVVEGAALSYEPHKIITYLNETAEHFHKFYHNHRVLNAGSTELAYARMKLCEAVKTVLKNGFTIIGIFAPERM